MAMTTPTITIKDSTTFTLNEADLTGKKVGELLETPKRTVPCSDGLQWWVRWYPAGDGETAKGHASVYLRVNKPVKVKFTFANDGSSSKTGTQEFIDPLGWGYFKFASHEELRRLFHDGKLTITCNVELDVQKLNFPVPRVFQLFEHVATDVEFVIGSERVPAHKSFLALISPVFRAMFAHKTAESKSGKIKITEFDVTTVKNAIDICYGRESEVLKVEATSNILRFCDKYFITAVTNELEKLPLFNPSVETFCDIVQYAYDCNKNSLLAACYHFLKEHQTEIKATKKFAELPLTLVVHVLKSAFDLKSDFDVLRHAYNNGIVFVMIHLEKPLLKSLTIDNFCDTVSYAWECSRKELQQACAKFLNERRDDVENLKAFLSLPSDIVGNVYKARYAYKHGAD